MPPVPHRVSSMPAKPHTRSHKHKSGEKQPADVMAVDAPLPDPSPPPPSTGNPSGSTPASDAGDGNEGDKGEVPPGPSSEALGTRGVASDMPHTSVFPDHNTPPPMSAMEVAITCTIACFFFFFSFFKLVLHHMYIVQTDGANYPNDYCAYALNCLYMLQNPLCLY